MGRGIRRTATTVSMLLAVAWLAILAVQPVHVPLRDFSKGHIPSYTQALSGIKGQTLEIPSESLSRIDIWVRTLVTPGKDIYVTFHLIRGMAREDAFASNTVVFSRSGRDWQARLVFGPEQISEGDRIYLRMESILSSPEAELHYAYVGGNLYPQGELLDFDRAEVPDQDLRFKLYRDPVLPKPLAWLEAAMAPALAAAEKAKGPAAWVVVSLLTLVGGIGTGLIVLTSILGARVFTDRNRREITAALFLGLTAVVSAIVAGAEAPIGKLWVNLS